MSDKRTDIVDRLRGIYTVPVNDGAGLLNGKDTFTQTFPVPPINKEAADLIDSLTDRLAAAEARIDRALALSDTGSAAHQERFYNHITGYEIPPGWRVVEAMRGELING